MKRMVLQILSLCMLFSLIASMVSLADETLTFLRIAEDSQAILVKLPNGTAKVLHVGDEAKGYGVVQTISEGKVVISADGGEVVIVSLKEDRQVIKRIKKIFPRAGNPESILLVPEGPVGAGEGSQRPYRSTVEHEK